jgi:predicted phosphodiesterase/predicted transcriptional regulator
LSINIESQARQQAFTILHDGGATNAEIADEMQISESTARDHTTGLVNNGVPLGTRKVDNGAKEYYYRPDEKEHPVNPSEPTAELRSKASVTKDAKKKVHELIQYLDNDLNGRAPATPEDGLTVRESNEDMVCHRSDDHIGAKYHDEYGNNTFNAEIGIDRVRTVSDRVFELKARQEAAGVDFDTLHIVMGGDHLHGIGIHSDMPWETQLSLPEQLTIASDIYMEFFDRASREFESVQIICQKGNHGELRGDGMGPEDNVDTAFFMTLDRRVRDRGYDNVQFIRSAGGNFTNFRMRENPGEDQKTAEALDLKVKNLPADLQSGHRAHLRHGHNALEHIGTSAGKQRWLAWKDKHTFDIAYRGHYHTFQIDSIGSTPVIESGAIVPPSDFEESLAIWGEPAATVHGCSDERTMTWMYPVNFEQPVTEEEVDEDILDIAL